MNKTTEEKIKSCSGNDGCAPDLNDGKAIVDKSETSWRQGWLIRDFSYINM